MINLGHEPNWLQIIKWAVIIIFALTTATSIIAFTFFNYIFWAPPTFDGPRDLIRFLLLLIYHVVGLISIAIIIDKITTD